ncbi:MAG: amidohydrolase family protein [Acidobacteria bacterium]|nr:amidohydrolase family protein [Acidobacteriota bacterium]
MRGRLLLGLLTLTLLSVTLAPQIAGGPLLASEQAAAPPSFDIIIRNGRVLDGTGNPWYRADIGIRGDRIAVVGRIDNARASTILDARDRYVTPGFIDVHSHAGPGLATRALQHGQPVLAQGITTVLVNPDGGGPVTIAEQRRTYETQGIGLNAGLFVPHGSIRQAVMGMSDHDPTAADLAKMVEMTRQGMDAGGVGLSSGLYYAPGSYSKTAEVVAMAKATAPFGGVYSSHIRDEADYSIGVVAAVDEVITVAEQAGVVGVVSHMKALGPASWGLSKTLVANIEAARSRGVQVFADQYPYEASGTGIVGALIPRSAQVGGREAMMRRITGELRAEVRAEVKTNIARRGGAGTLMISRYRPDPSLEGQRLDAIAARNGVEPEEMALRLLEKGDASLVSFNMSEDDIELIMRQPWTMTCTDGDLVPMGEGKPHPRAYGAFPRKLERYVRDRHVVGIADAIRSMTSLPASLYGLKDRGQIRAGAFADILIFDLAQVDDMATYENPHQLAAGFSDILVNGQWARRDGTFTTTLAGRVVVPDRR